MWLEFARDLQCVYTYMCVRDGSWMDLADRAIDDAWHFIVRNTHDIGQVDVLSRATSTPEITHLDLCITLISHSF